VAEVVEGAQEVSLVTQDGEFFDWGTHEVREIPGFGVVHTPALYYPHRMVAGVFTADAGRIRERLPSGSLHPVRWGRDRAAVMVMGTFYSCVSDPTHEQAIAFGASAVFVLVTHGEHDAPPFVPLLGLPVPERFHYGLFTLHMGETARPPIELGRRGYGIPKFLVDLRYEERAGFDRVAVSEGGQAVWSLTVRTSGKPDAFDITTAAYSDLDGDLLRAPMRAAGIQVQGRGQGCATLELGEHPVAEDLRGLGIDPHALACMFQPYRISVLDVPEVIGRADAGHHPGFEGSDAELGHMAISHAPGLDREMPYDLPLTTGG
jgi:hypothetical protein